MSDNNPTSLERSVDMIKITPDHIDQELITKYVSDPTAGAISSFIGTTRNNFDGKEVLELRYEAYNEMAEKQLLAICQSTRQKCNVCRIAVVHRTGVVPVGEASIVIAVSSTHRHDSLSAVSLIIDAVKSCATIWKKEIYKDGGDEWKINKECSWN